MEWFTKICNNKVENTQTRSLRIIALPPDTLQSLVSTKKIVTDETYIYVGNTFQIQ